MPAPDVSLSQHSFHVPPHRTRSVRSPQEKTTILPGQLSPRTFITQLDEKLALLQQQRTNDVIPSPHP